MFKFKIKMITIILLFILHKDIFFRWIDKKDVHIFIHFNEIFLEEIFWGS